jgi:hypothetical protein
MQGARRRTPFALRNFLLGHLVTLIESITMDHAARLVRACVLPMSRAGLHQPQGYEPSVHLRATDTFSMSSSLGKGPRTGTDED